MEKLFSLIKSLDGMEKRYFKLAVSVHKEAGMKNYMRLFTAIAKQRTYNDEALREEFKNDAIVKRFDMSKNYLYRLLLNTLQNYHRNSSVELQLINLLNRASVLYNKMLYKSCMELLNKARELAKRYEYYELLLQIIQKTVQVAIEEGKDTAYMDQLYKEHEHALERSRRINDYRKLYQRLYTFFTTKGNDLRVGGIKTQYLKFLNDPLLSNVQKPTEYEEKSYYYLTHSLCYFCLGEADKSYEYTQLRLNLIKSRPERMVEDPDTYVIVLNSVIFYGSVIYKIRECESAFTKLEQFLVNFPSKRHKIFVAYDNMIALYLTAGKFKEGLVYANKAKAELAVYEEKVFASNKVSLYHDMFYVYFGCQQFEESLEWLNKLLNETKLNVREDIQVTARMTNLILHYELKHFDLLPYLIRRAYSFLYKRKRLHKLEKIFLNFLGKLLHVNPYVKKELIAVFIEIKDALEQLTRDPNEAMVMTEYFDYISWLDSKINNRSFERIVREKAQKRQLV